MEQASLESPLIMPSSHSMHKSLFACDDGREGTGRRGDAVAEIKQQLWLSGPLITSSLLQMALQIISVMFVGHLGELPLSGAAMATSFAGVTGFSLLMGMGSALDTLCGQSYGAKQYHLLGIHMQRAMLVLMLVSIPIAVVWAYAGQLLAAIGQDPEIALEAGLYARWLIPTIFAYGLLQCLARFLQTQSIVLPIMLCSGVTTLLHVLACWVLVFKSSLGSKGAALAISLSYWINMLLLVLYVKLSPACRKTWTGFSREALSGILGFVRLAIPSAVMVCMEFWAFELLVLLSGLLPNPNLETSVTAISLNTCELLFMIPFGLSAVVSIRVSNELGAGWPQAARLAVAVSVSLAVVQGSIVCLAMVLGRGVWGYAFSNEEGVVKYMEVMLPILGAFKLVDGVQCVLSGVARGCGWQRIGAYINLGTYYTVGIPSAILLAFVFHIGGKGLWLGITGGIVVQMLLLITVTLCTNWEKEARKARDRHYSSTMPENMAT